MFEDEDPEQLVRDLLADPAPVPLSEMTYHLGNLAAEHEMRQIRYLKLGWRKSPDPEEIKVIRALDAIYKLLTSCRMTPYEVIGWLRDIADAQKKQADNRTGGR